MLTCTLVTIFLITMLIMPCYAYVHSCYYSGHILVLLDYGGPYASYAMLVATCNSLVIPYCYAQTTCYTLLLPAPVTPINANVHALLFIHHLHWDGEN